MAPPDELGAVEQAGIVIVGDGEGYADPIPKLHTVLPRKNPEFPALPYPADDRMLAVVLSNETPR
jgi:hypothetical protein